MNEAVTVKKREQTGDEARTLSTGVRARLRPVGQGLIQDALVLIKRPPVPLWYNEDKERDEPNPADPDYRAELEKFVVKQFRATFDTLALFGVELVDGMPEDDKWLRKLKLAHKRGTLDLSEFDLEDEVDREFLYIRYIALADEDYPLISSLSNNEEAVSAAADGFQGSEVRGSDNGGES